MTGEVYEKLAKLVEQMETTEILYNGVHLKIKVCPNLPPNTLCVMDWKRHIATYFDLGRGTSWQAKMPQMF